MHAELAPPASNANPEWHSDARVHRRWRLLARGVWITMVIGTLGIFFASLPVYVAQLRTPCTGSSCGYQQLSPTQATALAHFGLSVDAYVAYLLVIAGANVLVCLIMSALIALRKPDERMAFIVALMLVTLGPLMMSENVAQSTSVWRVPNQYLSNLCIALLFLVFALFPTGRFVPRWLRWPVVVIIIATASEVGADLKIGAVALGFVVFLVEAALLVVMQLYRYRRVSSPRQQQQTKWVVVGLAVPITLWVIALVPYLVFPAFAMPESLYLPAYTATQGLPLLAIPLTFGLAMLRYRLWDIDTLISRTLLYGTLTLTLSSVFTGLVLGLQGLLGAIGVIRQGSGATIVLSTLASVVLVQPLRQFLQRIIDRRFYRRKYDAVKVLAAFSTTLRQEVDLDRLHEQVLAVVHETMQPTQVSMWLRPAGPRDGAPIRE
jgi:hypothetical protein